MPDRERVAAFVACVEEGRFVAALEEFYRPEASVRENLAPPKTGRDKLVAAERRTLEQVRSIRTRKVQRLLIDANLVAINWVFEIEYPDGRTAVLDEVALQRWEGDRIVEEQFYYDPAQTRSAGT